MGMHWPNLKKMCLAWYYKPNSTFHTLIASHKSSNISFSIKYSSINFQRMIATLLLYYSHEKLIHSHNLCNTVLLRIIELIYMKGWIFLITPLSIFFLNYWSIATKIHSFIKKNFTAKITINKRLFLVEINWTKVGI